MESATPEDPHDEETGGYALQNKVIVLLSELDASAATFILVLAKMHLIQAATSIWFLNNPETELPGSVQHDEGVFVAWSFCHWHAVMMLHNAWQILVVG